MNILAVCVAQPTVLPGKKHKTGINKRPTDGLVRVGVDGIEGDAICNRKYHGGPEQVVYVEGGLSLDWWSQELGISIHPGQFGENLVIGGLDNTLVAAGDRLTIGDLILEATAPRMPCATFAARMADPLFVKRYRKALRPGFYCRVLRIGSIRAGMLVAFQPYAGESIKMTDMMRDFGRRVAGEELARYLAAPIHSKLRASLATGLVKF